jgi:hypothetical protein
LLRTFSKEEFREFGKFIASPFFAKGRNVVPLYRYMKKYYPEFDSPKMTHEEAFSKIFPGKKFSLQVLRNHLTAMQKMCEEYLVTKGFSEKIKQRDIILLEELRNRKQYNFYDSRLKQAEKSYKFEGNIDIDLFYDLSALETEKIYNYAQRAQYSKYFEAYIANSENIIMTMLLGIFEMVPNTIGLSKAYDLSAANTLIEKMDEVINYDDLFANLRESNHKYYEILATYYYLYKAFKNPGDNSYYNNCRDLVFKNFARFSRQQVFGFLLHMETYCINKVHENKGEFNKEAVKVYRFMFEKDIFTHSKNDFISGVIFRNIILKAESATIDWTEKFVKKYLEKLPPELRETMKYFWEAKKGYLKQDFEKVIEAAIKIRYDVYGLKMDVKQMYLVSYYELGFYEEARSMMDSLIKYLNLNNEVVNIYREGHMNYISIYRKLLKLKEVPDIEAAGELRKEILEIKTLANREWLLEKTQELGK